MHSSARPPMPARDERRSAVPGGATPAVSVGSTVAPTGCDGVPAAPAGSGVSAAVPSAGSAAAAGFDEPDERRFSASRFDELDEVVFDDADDPGAVADLDGELRALRAEHRARRLRERHADAVPLPSVAAPTRSIEVFPARSLRQLRRNVASVRTMLGLGTDFVTVTYGAAGSRQAGTKELVGWLVEAGVPTYAHLTCQATDLPALDATIDELLALGVTGVLALRGDPVADGGGLVLPHATDLIARVRQRAERAGRAPDDPLRIAVAVFPTGHPDSRDLVEDAENVARKQDAGADFAITQNFFDAADYERFMTLVDRTGATLPVVPGLTPTPSVRRLERIAELSDLTPPPALAAALAEAPDDETRRDIAVRTTAELAERLAHAGAPGIQLFTMNDATTAVRILRMLDDVLDRHHPDRTPGHQATGAESTSWQIDTQGPASKAAPSSATRASGGGAS